MSEYLPQENVQASQTPSLQSSTSSSKRKMLYLVLALLLVLVMILGALVGIILLRSKSDSDAENDETAVSQTEITTDEEEGVRVEEEGVQNEEDDTDDEQPPQDNNQVGDETGQDTDKDEFDMTSLWPTYDNATYKFKLKYPKGLMPDEQNIDSSTLEVAFEAGDLLAFTVWVKQGGQLDNNLQLMIAIQCSQSVSMADASYGGYTYRKALDEPDEQCLQQLGITRDQPFASFGRVIGSSTYLMLRNDGLIDEQLEAVLGSIEYY